MLDALIERIRQGHRTIPFPAGLVDLPERFRGRPKLDARRCIDGCQACMEQCPTEAVKAGPLQIDLGACLFCKRCEEVCPQGAIAFTRDHKLAACSRAGLVVATDAAPALATALERRRRRLFARSLKLRQVSAGGCNGCEAELVVLGNVVFDLGRFGIQFVASPRHADGIVVTGPVTRNMELAFHETYAAIPEPKVVIAIGACSISGGVFAGTELTQRGIPRDISVDLYVPGCPPHPLTLLDGLLRLIGRLEG